MKTVNDLVDEVYCINLDQRKDRWEKVEESFSAMGVQVSRFPAVNGDAITIPPDAGDSWNRDIHHNKNSIGCALSHFSVMQDAEKKGHKEILILEDDAQPCTDFSKLFSAYYEQLPSDYNFCYLGGNNVHPPKSFSENIGIATLTKSTVSYLIKMDFAKEVMPLIHNNIFLYAVDEVYVGLQQGAFENKNPIYTFVPRLIHQFESYSDITKKDANYSQMKDLD